MENLREAPAQPTRPPSRAAGLVTSFIMKLQAGAELTAEDLMLIHGAVGAPFAVHAGDDLIRRGQIPSNVHLILEGLACRYKILPDGSRAIMAYLLPGDLCDLHVAILNEMDHSIAALTRCAVARISHERIEHLLRSPRIARALWWSTLVDEATLRQWLVNMGRRSADRQLAHLLCELRQRYEVIGRATDTTFRLPVTQAELADTLGLSAVHVNRIMQQLREDHLIVVQGRMVTIPDAQKLEEFCGFSADYLHIKKPHH